MEFKDRIKELRINKKMTIVELSKKSGLSVGMIGSIENGTRNPSKKTIKKLAEVFKVSEDWLETGEDKTSIVNDFLQRLVDENIVTDPNNIPDNIKEAILKNIEAEIALLLQKKK